MKNKELNRFGVSMDSGLLQRFDEHIQEKGYTNRSEAIRDLVRLTLNEEQVHRSESPVFGVIMYVYDHHRKDSDDSITDFQHRHTDSIIFSNHIHIDHDNCLEMVIVRDTADKIQNIANRLFARRGVSLGKTLLAIPSEKKRC